MARAPDIVEMSFVFRDEPARVFATLLGLVDGAPHLFELSEAAEQRALAIRPSRTPPGYSPPDFGAKTSSRIRTTATYSSRADTLRLEGFFADLSTAIPPRSMRYAIVSPSFVMPPPGWDALFRRLSAARAPLDETFARVSLHAGNGRSIVEIAFQPPR